jgi:basic amino acid/polyamine antiporter, APA family
VQTLQRRLGVPAAVAIGVASMLGAGIFFVWSPATSAAGAAVLIALPLAALIAILNALSTTRLAMRHPVSGGAYAYGRAELNPTVGFIAGVLFLIGKTASVAAIGLIAGGYLWPGSERVVAIGLVVVLAAINATGVRTTAAVSAVAAGIVVMALLGALAWASAAHVSAAAVAPVVWPPLGTGAVSGVLTATGLIFFAFAGYARIATLAEEVRDPVRTLPRAVVLSITVVLVLSALTLVVLLTILGTTRLSASGSPVADAIGDDGGWLVRVAVSLACVGSMTGVLAGLSRTSLAMSRDRELPAVLARVSTRAATPVVADVAVAVVASVAVLLLDPARVIGVSACAVLFYYAIAHLAALRAGATIGLPRLVPVAGLAGCVLIGLSTPWPALVGVVAAAGAAVLIRLLAARVRRRSVA